MTLTVRGGGTATVTVDGRERHEIGAVLADDWEAARRDVIAMSEACASALDKLPLQVIVTVGGAVAWAGRLAAEDDTPAGSTTAQPANWADDLAALPSEPGTPPQSSPQPEARLDRCADHAGEDHVQVRTHGHWMCIRSLRGLDDDYKALAGLAAGVQRVIGRYEAEELNAMEAFGEIEELFQRHRRDVAQ